MTNEREIPRQPAPDRLHPSGRVPSALVFNPLDMLGLILTAVQADCSCSPCAVLRRVAAQLTEAALEGVGEQEPST